ncbi:MAG: exonuclease domain-containing protein [Ruminococcus sp.]|nr:exonuclease domain-containing protein [Ruminococcus sp.]
MNFVILDLEWNGAYSKKSHKFVNEIIEFGAVKVDEQFNILDSFSMLISPQIGKKLNSRVAQLTHITTEELMDSHNTFTHVLSKFRKFLGDSVLLTWGTSDILTLMENCKYYLGEEKLSFMTTYCNLQSYCEYMLGHNDKSRQMGLSTCAEQIGVSSEGLELHRAFDDAMFSLLCFKELFDFSKIKEFIEVANDEFYRKITFKNTVLYDVRNPLIDKKEFYICCDKCGKKARKKSKWVVKNRSFRAQFKCNKCRREFEGRITFRLKYEGVTVDRRVVEKNSSASKEKTKCVFSILKKQNSNSEK